jgi:SSS family solute:Na+ symporter
MADWAVILTIILLYLVIVMSLGILSSRKRQNTFEEYVNASRNLGFFVNYFLLGASIFSAFAFLGGPGWAYSRGAASFYLLGYATFGLLPWYVFGPRIMHLGTKFGFSTQAELIRARFNSKWLSVIMAIISIMAFIQYICLQMKGSGYVLTTLTDGRIPFWAGALVGYAVVLVYVFWGGIRGVAWTNVFQGIFMIAIAWFLGLYIPDKLYGGIGPMFREIAQADMPHLLIGEPGSHISYAYFSSAILVSALGFLMWPHLFMRSYSVRNVKVIKQTIVAYPSFSIFLVPVLIIGFAGIHFAPPALIDKPDAILPYMIRNMNFPVVIVGLFGAGTLAAAMSTQDAITHAASTIFAKDLYSVVVNHEPDEKEMLWCIRGAVLVFGAVSYLIAVFGGQSLVKLLLGAYGTIVQFFPLVVSVFFWPRANGRGAIAGLLTGVAVNYLIEFDLIAKSVTLDIHSGMWGLLANVVVLISASLLTKADEAEHVRKFTG